MMQYDAYNMLSKTYKISKTNGSWSYWKFIEDIVNLYVSLRLSLDYVVYRRLTLESATKYSQI